MESAPESRIQPCPYRLYQLGWCGYCQMVRFEAEKLGMTLTLVDVDEDRAARRMLIRELGRATVPVLGIPTKEGERLLPESREIVRFLRAHAREQHSKEDVRRQNV